MKPHCCMHKERDIMFPGIFPTQKTPFDALYEKQKHSGLDLRPS